jgi:hypothetical protein
VSKNIGELFIEWAHRARAIKVVLLIGSRARNVTQIDSFDSGSDWDFQVVTSDPTLFDTVFWLKEAGLPAPLAYVRREGRLGRVFKITSVFPDSEIDVAILPLRDLVLARSLWALKLGRVLPATRSAFAEISMILRGGWRFLKGTSGWEYFFESIATSFAPTRLSDAVIINMAEGYVCDYVSALRKISRGEFLAAQRWLHNYLAETNFALLHELRLRSGKLSFPDARRIEMICEEDTISAVSINAKPTRDSLLVSVNRSADTFRLLIFNLLGSKWAWPL